MTLLSDPVDAAYQTSHEVTAGKPLWLPEPFGVQLDTAALFA